MKVWCDVTTTDKEDACVIACEVGMDALPDNLNMEDGSGEAVIATCVLLNEALRGTCRKLSEMSVEDLATAAENAFKSRLLEVLADGKKEAADAVPPETDK